MSTSAAGESAPAPAAAPAAGGFTWTDDQRRGIETVGHSLLVSAAAGSGKTAVLAARCAHLVCDAPEPHRCDVDELLVVTFTKAAAAEMRDRIERALRQRLGASDDVRLARQLMLLDRAHISTLHSFCATVLRKHFNLVGLDPNFRTLDPEEAVLLRIEAARQLLADRYESDPAGQFQQFIDAYADGDDERVLPKLIGAHDMLCSVVDRQGWLEQARARIAQAASARAIEESDLGREMVRLLRSRLDDFRRRCVDAATQFAQVHGLESYGEAATELIAATEVLLSLFADGDFDRLSHAVAAFDVPEVQRTSGSIPGKDEAKKLIDKLRGELREGGDLHDLCRFTADEWRDGLRYTLPAIDVFIDLVKQFTSRYTAAKAEIGALDFNDLERLTLDVLRTRGLDGSALAASSTARVYHRQFKHVLVDEYQDINEVQDAILTLVSRESAIEADDAGSNLFCVGDVKQSIYRFRLADPARFLERDNRLRACRDKSLGEVIDLQSNFRSRGPLLDALNCVFERLMTRPATEIEYDASHRLHAGAKYPPNRKCRAFEGAPIEVQLLPEPSSGGGPDDEEELELDRTEREAAFVAHRIRALLGGEGAQRFHVLDKNADGEPSYRPIRYRDIVILLRATQYKAAQFADMLRANRIPVHTEAGSGFFGSTEIRDLLALLSILDNLQQDIPLAAVLRSPLSGLAESDDGLARVRLAYPARGEDGLPFHRAVVRYAHEKDDELAAHLRDLLGRLDEWRRLAHQRPVAEVLWEIYDSTGYLAFCAGLDDGEQRATNLIRLHERARQFGTFQRQGLRRFIQFLRSLEQEQDLGQPSIASEADDVVKVMSIHRSKGLEFPVVILPDLGKRHNFQDLAGPILIDRQAGLGLMCVDETKRIRYPSMASVLVRERIRRQNLAEELRVLYVGMTRAREHLILVGTCTPDRPAKWAARWANHEGPLPPDDVLRGASMLDWLGPVAGMTARLSPAPFALTMHDEDEVRAWSAPTTQRPQFNEQQQRLALLESLDPPPNTAHPDADRIRRRLTDSYPHRPFTTLAASQTVGSLTKRGRSAFGGESASRDEVVRFGEGLPPPRCVLESLTASPLEIGSAIHLVLEHLDVSRPCTRDDLEQQIRQMIDRKLIAPSEAQVVDLGAIEWLMTRDVGRLLRDNAGALRREVPVFFPLNMIDSPDPLDRVMIRGRIDALIPDAGGLVLIDYKTDRVTPDTIDARVDFYRPQVHSYARAIESIVGEPVKSVHLVFLTAREIRTMHVGME